MANVRLLCRHQTSGGEHFRQTWGLFLKGHKIEKYKCEKMPLSVHFALVLAIIIEHCFQILRDAGAVAISLPTEV